MKAIDALHAAAAEAAGCDWLLTCDDRATRRYRGALRMASPVDFVLEMSGGDSGDDESD